MQEAFNLEGFGDSSTEYEDDRVHTMFSGGFDEEEVKEEEAGEAVDEDSSDESDAVDYDSDDLGEGEPLPVDEEVAKVKCLFVCTKSQPPANSCLIFVDAISVVTTKCTHIRVLLQMF